MIQYSSLFSIISFYKLSRCRYFCLSYYTWKFLIWLWLAVDQKIAKILLTKKYWMSLWVQYNANSPQIDTIPPHMDNIHAVHRTTFCSMCATPHWRLFLTDSVMELTHEQYLYPDWHRYHRILGVKEIDRWGQRCGWMAVGLQHTVDVNKLLINFAKCKIIITFNKKKSGISLDMDNFLIWQKAQLNKPNGWSWREDRLKIYVQQTIEQSISEAKS